MASQIISNITTIWAIGRNYSAHAQEMGAKSPTNPVVFLKSPATITESDAIHLPDWSKNIHHELELAVRVGKNNSPSHVALALDLTARDKQTELKKAGLPWAMAKSFNQSCPLSSFIEYQGNSWFEGLSFELSVNETIRQYGQAKSMIFNLQNIISYLDTYFPLREGDLILTGTPEGVGPLKKGDQLRGEIPGLLTMSWQVH